ncbi:MAG: argininosuccinate lyase [Endomicrobia bacterium]|nr:argininosuccinate lyase [Endomicrobiia bacterium]
MKEKSKLKKFLSSFYLDKKLAKYDAEACIVWTQQLVKNKIIKKQQAEILIDALKKIKNKPEKIKKSEDIHFALEVTLEKMLKENKNLAGIIRTARSRNDLVVSDERMFIKEEIVSIVKLLKNVIESIINLSIKNIDVAMVGYTHLQPAQPVLFSHYILSFAWWFIRDIERFKDCYRRVDVSVLGSAAFAGSSFEIDRKEVARKLKFMEISHNSVDSVSDRDFIAEFIFCCATVMMHMSRIAEEFILWSSPNFGYIKLPKELTSGSSIMPQKQNPDYLELVRGKATKVYCDLLGILVLMKNLPLTYNRDMQEDKVYLFSSVDVVKDCLDIIKLVFDNVKLNVEKMKNDLLKYDFILSTEIANFLVEKLNLSYKEAHRRVRQLIEYSLKVNKKLTELNYKDYQSVINISSNMFDELKDRLSIEKVGCRYKTFGGSSISEVKRQIKKLKSLLIKLC